MADRLADPWDHGRETTCYCSACRMPPCSWCTDYSRECEHCGHIVDQDEHCCGFYANGDPAPTAEELADARAKFDLELAQRQKAKRKPVDWAAILSIKPSAPNPSDPSVKWDGRRKPRREGA